MKLPNIDEVAAKVHAGWVKAKENMGITTRLHANGEELMKPYDQLSEEAKELSRNRVKEVHDATMEVHNESQVPA